MYPGSVSWTGNRGAEKGRSGFYALQKRTLLTDRFKIELEAAGFLPLL